MEQVVAAIPYLLGFKPQESLIVQFVNDGEPSLTVRFDAADLPTREIAEKAVQDMLTRPITENGLDKALVVTWRDTIDVDTDRAILAGVTDALTALDVSTLDTLVTDGQTVRSTMCVDPACRCAAGLPITQAVRDTVASEFVARGSAPAADRASVRREWADHEVAANLQQAAELGQSAMGTGLDDLSQDDRRALLTDVQWMTGALTGPTLPANATMNIARLMGKACADVRVRDALVMEVKELGGDDLRAYAANIRTLALGLPGEASSIAATLAGHAHWLSGDGVRASTAFDHALRTNPDNRLAALMMQAYEQGMSPQHWRDMARGDSLTTASMLNISEPALASSTPAGPTTAGPALGL